MASPLIQQEAWARLVFGISVVAFAIGELSQALKSRRHASRADVRGEVVFRLIFFAGILMLPFARAEAPQAVLDSAGVFALGTVICWLGLLLRWWSFATLGEYFTFVVRASSDQRVVERGPYRVLRHPSYTGLLAVFVGYGLMLGNWAGAAACSLLVLVGLIFRLLREERAMVESVGDAYADFAEDRARLFPFVW